jgi:nucleotide-binding universal stress UspA family protein
MFEQLVVGIRDDQAGRDAIALTMELAAGDGAVTLLHVQVISTRPGPDSGAVGAAAKYRYAIERLTALANECAIAARVSCVEAHSPQRGLHEFASRQHADLLVVGASDRDEVGRLLLGDDTREVLEDAPCAVAIAPAGYASRAASIRTIGVAYDRSVESERALELARTLAADHHAELSAFEALRPPVNERDPANVAGESSELADEARRRIAALGGVHADASVGDPVDELRQYGQSVRSACDRLAQVRTDRPRVGGKHLPAAGGRAVHAVARPRRPMNAERSRRPSTAQKAATPRYRQFAANR